MCARTPLAGAKDDGVRSSERFFSKASPNPGWTGSTGRSI